MWFNKGWKRSTNSQRSYTREARETSRHLCKALKDFSYHKQKMNYAQNKIKEGITCHTMVGCHLQMSLGMCL
jgi:hypothetical protein